MNFCSTGERLALCLSVISVCTEITVNAPACQPVFSGSAIPSSALAVLLSDSGANHPVSGQCAKPLTLGINLNN
jgi:hypothetical protein